MYGKISHILIFVIRTGFSHKDLSTTKIFNVLDVPGTY